MDEKLWNLLIRRIDDQRCTPFLGAGACVPALPLGETLPLSGRKSLAIRWIMPPTSPRSLNISRSNMTRSFPKKRFWK